MRRHVPRRWDTGRKHQAGRSQGCQRKPANDLPASDLHGSPKVNRLFHAVYPAGVPGPFESSRRAQRARPRRSRRSASAKSLNVSQRGRSPLKSRNSTTRSTSFRPYVTAATAEPGPRPWYRRRRLLCRYCRGRRRDSST